MSVAGLPATASHLFSLYFLLPFLGVSVALWIQNRHPAKIFVGDTYCYFAGMTFAVVGILGRFSKTVLLLFIPQMFNFLYSSLQLFRLLSCPRHRLPRFDVRTGLMEPSRAQFVRPPKWHIGLALKALELGLIQLWTTMDADGGRTDLEFSNLTLIDLFLVRFGLMREDRLTRGLVWVLHHFVPACMMLAESSKTRAKKRPRKQLQGTVLEAKSPNMGSNLSRLSLAEYSHWATLAQHQKTTHNHNHSQIFALH